ncbi:hypothetical protein QJS66_15690 [Kocuria rhizophila]|nr:hypothetical protein QJS66_15690 [Kocuria rhizophila]
MEKRAAAQNAWPRTSWRAAATHDRPGPGHLSRTAPRPRSPGERQRLRLTSCPPSSSGGVRAGRALRGLILATWTRSDPARSQGPRQQPVHRG